MAEYNPFKADFPPVEFLRSRARSAAANFDPTKPVQYDQFQPTKSLELLEIFKSSSVVGPSYAKIRLAPGRPIAPELDPENGAQVLALGDRVAVRFVDSQTFLFGGYCTTAALLIDAGEESLTYRISGPEWPLGVGETQGGANVTCYGQWRRIRKADDDYFKDVNQETKLTDLRRFTDLLAVFNPQGRPNMTKHDVELIGKSGNVASLKGKIFDEIDRIFSQSGGTPDDKKATLLWNALEATKMVVSLYNMRDVTDVLPPNNWEAVPMKSTDVLRADVSIEGLGVYAAIAQILHPRFAFYIDPRPERVNGSKWGPFRMYFFARSTGTDTRAANFWLNPRGTPMVRAKASVSRVEAAGDTTKIVNRAVVAGKYLRPVRLVWFGDQMGGLNEQLKKIALQPAWSDKFKLRDYADGMTGDAGDPPPPPPQGEAAPPTKPKTGRVDRLILDKNGKLQEWQDRYIVTGKDFAKHEDVFRRFIWNEAAEWMPGPSQTGKAVYGGKGQAGSDPISLDWYAPNLDDIADAPPLAAPGYGGDFKGVWCRRRRPLHPLLFKATEGTSDELRRPTLYFSIGTTGQTPSSWQWRKIPESCYELDPFRAGFRITVDDLSVWQPFDKQKGATGPVDARSYATLLNQGVLRMCLEGAVEVDWAMKKVASPTSGTGTPHAREIFVRNPQAFVEYLPAPFGITINSPTGAQPVNVTTGAEAQAYADRLRDAGQEISIHASILVEGDWNEEPIGTAVNTLYGREIGLTTAAGRGAQIVATRLDIANGQYEYLTESAALALREKDRRRFASGTKVYESRSKRRTWAGSESHAEP